MDGGRESAGERRSRVADRRAEGSDSVSSRCEPPSEVAGRDKTECILRFPEDVAAETREEEAEELVTDGAVPARTCD